MIWRNSRTLSAEMLSELWGLLKSQRVMVYFPEFMMNTWYSLLQSLLKIEMPTAFTGAADFSDKEVREADSLTIVFTRQSWR